MTRRSRSAPLGLAPHEKLVRLAAASTDVISLAGGLPDPTLFPTNELGDALFRALSHSHDSPLQYGWPEGDRELRAYVAGELERRGADVSPSDVIITSGAQQAIAIALSSIPRCRRVEVDPETYPGALDIFRGAGLRVKDEPFGAQALYVMPSVSNPLGQRMSDGRKRELLARALADRSFLIEDDAYAETWFSGEVARPLVADHRDRVFHVGTFSKTLCPGLRIGWLVPPPHLARRALREKQRLDLQANGLAQALLVEYLKSGHFESHKRRAREHYRKKARRLIDSVRRHLPNWRFVPPGGGFSLWLESGLELDDQELLETAIAQGVSFDPGRLFRISAGRLALRLCYSAIEARDIDEGVRRLAGALERYLDSSRGVARRAPPRRAGTKGS